MPRNSDMAAWVWVSMRPGARMASGRSTRCFAANGDRAAGDDAVLRVLGDEIPAAPDPIGRFGRERANEEEEPTDTIHRKASGRGPSNDGLGASQRYALRSSRTSALTRPTWSARSTTTCHRPADGALTLAVDCLK